VTGTTPADPPETPIQFDPNGGQLMVTLTCGQAQMGTYTLRLWTPDGMTELKKARGSFFDEEEDVYPLPLPTADNDRRLLQCRARVWLIQGNRNYSVFMTVSQDGVKLGEVSEEDDTDEVTVVVDLRARLIGVPQ
jgi:hypothetical protein